MNFVFVFWTNLGNFSVLRPLVGRKMIFLNLYTHFLAILRGKIVFIRCKLKFLGANAQKLVKTPI